jgi:DNA topoisomerase-1
VQRGEAVGTGKNKVNPKRSSVPKTIAPADVNLENALALLSLPRDVGPDAETSEMIVAGIGRFGPYIKLGGTYVSLKGDDNVLTIGLNRAVHLLASKPRKAPPKTLGNHPENGKPVFQKVGRWGPFVQHGQVMATLPKDANAESFTLDQAVELLKAKAGRAKAAKAPKKKAAGKTKKKAAPETAADPATNPNESSL